MGSKISKKFQTPAIRKQKTPPDSHYIFFKFLHKPCKLKKKTIQVVPEKSQLPRETLLKMDFQQKLQNSAVFGYFYVKLIWKLLQKIL